MGQFRDPQLAAGAHDAAAVRGRAAGAQPAPIPQIR